MLAMKCAGHCLVVYTHQFTICNGDRRTHAQRLCCKATFSEEVGGIQYCNRRLLASSGDNGEFYLALLDIKERVTFCALRVNSLLLSHAQNCSTVPNIGEELVHVEFDIFG